MYHDDHLADVFRHHPPQGDQAQRYAEVRAAALEFARAVNRLCPDGADKAASIRLIREAMFTANAAIALQGRNLIPMPVAPVLTPRAPLEPPKGPLVP